MYIYIYIYTAFIQHMINIVVGLCLGFVVLFLLLYHIMLNTTTNVPYIMHFIDIRELYPSGDIIKKKVTFDLTQNEILLLHSA